MAPAQLLVDLAGVVAAFDREFRIAALAGLSGLPAGEVDQRLYLSNNDALVGSLIRTYLPGVAARCDTIVVSGVTGVRKPAAGAYAAGLAALGANAAGCVFVDDSRSNVEGGRAAGIDSVLHTDPAQLARGLVERGIVTR